MNEVAPYFLRGARVRSSRAVPGLIALLAIGSVACLVWPVQSADRIQFSDPNQGALLQTNLSSRPSFDSLDKESSLGGILDRGVKNSGKLTRSPFRPMLNSQRESNRPQNHLPTIDELLNPKAHQQNEANREANAHDPFEAFREKPSLPRMAPRPNSDAIAEGESSIVVKPQKSALGSGSLQFNTLINPGSDRPVIAVSKKAEFIIDPGQIEGKDMLKEMEREKERQKSRMDTFRNLLQPTAVLPKVAPSHLGTDPINTAIDLSRENLTPFTPMTPRGLVQNDQENSGTMMGISAARSRLQEQDQRTPAAYQNPTPKHLLNEPPRPRPTASFLPIPKRAF